ncbi:MAG: type I methionyl aminopeptidase [Candidatus Azosocius agrarius]|nr:MAG: type I methionyl aminopeptidase [Gammaproteobacteria bacterium]
MKNLIKTKDKINKIRLSSKLASEVLIMIEKYIKPNITTNLLNNICHKFITKIQKATPAPLNYNGYPKSICTSINNVICHGIPNNTILKNGDIINIDITIKKNNYYGDTSKTFIVGKTTNQIKNLVINSQKCLYYIIHKIKPNLTIGDIGYFIQNYAQKKSLSIVKEYCGHGIGINFHENPKILHYGKKKHGIKLKKGMVFTIEPMLNLGKCTNEILNDNWTVVTKDKFFSSQWEHTILITHNKCEILTLRNDENINMF